MASQKLLREELSPLVASYEAQLDKQQDLVNSAKWLSPALLVQESLNKMAGVSTDDYKEFRMKVTLIH